MMKVLIPLLKLLRKLHAIFLGQYVIPVFPRETNVDRASEDIHNLLVSDKPCMIARFGAFELSVVLNYLEIKSDNHSSYKFIIGKEKEWWWNKNIMKCMESNAGFFPPTEEKISQFCDLILNDIKELDYLGSWIPDEFFLKDLIDDVPKTLLPFLEPYWSNRPWARVLTGKKVLVVHPFAELIEKQYRENREKLFDNPDVLPQFELQTLKAVQSLGGEDNGFRDWFEALQWMEDEIDKRDYDICLIGCGAYGFPLAAHVKRQGKKAVHLGGALQLLFGIRGKRWDDPNYGIQEFGKQNTYKGLFNQYWVYPGQQDKPECANNVENGCYW